MITMKHWIEAARPRTLPLALSSIFLGSFLAASFAQIRWDVFGLCVLTTIFLQILSNLANDYGDHKSGLDGEGRKGPQRMVQAGAISPEQMKGAMKLFVVLSFVTGVVLLLVSLWGEWKIFVTFLTIGILSIVAAITYTAGDKPYGYVGLGDISVLIFFGLVGVLGTYFLHTLSFEARFVLPALSCGFFSVAVLNVNNIRDMESDAVSGKKSIPVRLGRVKAVYYHLILLAGGWAFAIVFTKEYGTSAYNWLFVGSIPLFLRNARAIMHYTEAEDIDPFLKQLAISTLVFVVLFGLGFVLG
jgi:1,4-dihydroxy-2-naphthoate polyprenyltransferase